jgi:pimeloyl-ACP methyl ester carboxylesterase
MPPNLYESDGNNTKVTSDLVVVDTNETDDGRTHHADDVKIQVNGNNGASSGKQDGQGAGKLEWHRELVETYKLIEQGAIEGLSVVQASTDKVGEDLAKFHEDLNSNLEGLQKDAGLQLEGFTGLLFSDDSKKLDKAIVQATEKVERELGLKPGPTITLHCIDNIGGKFKALELKVQWSQSFEDVLRMLKESFKRDVIFEYEVGGRVIRVQDDSSFDRAIALAEGSGDKLYVVIQEAVWAVPPLEEIEPEEPEPEEEPLIITCANRMDYSPVPYKPLLFFGLVGLALSLVMCLVSFNLFGNDGTYMLALSVSIPVPYFIHGFTVSVKQTVEPTVVKSLVAVVGTGMGLTVIYSYYQLPAIDGVIGAAMWSLSTMFFLWVCSPLYVRYWNDFIKWVEAQRKGKKAPLRRKPSPAQSRAALLQSVKTWVILTLYSIVYITLQYTPLQHATNLIALESRYQPMGRLLPRNEKGEKNHIFCTGFTDPAATVDNRPVVIFEAMEGLGQALAVAGVQERVARIGIACAYDRAGFGWSDPFKASDNRAPDAIAAELHYLLSKTNISVLIPPRTGSIEPAVKYVKPPYVLVGHSVGSLYMRKFANMYKTETAAVVLWDPLPSQDKTLGKKYMSSVASKLGAGILSICTMYLEPMGLIDLFLRSMLITPLFDYNNTLQKSKLEGGIGSDLDRMVARMLKRNWCPSVAKEHKDLYAGAAQGIPGFCRLVPCRQHSGWRMLYGLGWRWRWFYAVLWVGGLMRVGFEKKRGCACKNVSLCLSLCVCVCRQRVKCMPDRAGGKPGIITVVEADNAGYTVPFVVWTRMYSAYNKVDEYKQSYQIQGTDACSVEHTGIANPDRNHPEGTTGWACVGFKVLCVGVGVGVL